MFCKPLVFLFELEYGLLPLVFLKINNMKKLLVILFLFIGISAYADKIQNFDNPIYISNIDDGMSSIFPAYKIRNVDNGFFGVGEIHKVSITSKLRRFGIQEGSIVFFVTDLPYRAIMEYLHIYIMGYYFKLTPSGYKRYLLLGIGNSR